MFSQLWDTWCYNDYCEIAKIDTECSSDAAYKTFDKSEVGKIHEF